MLSEKPTQRQFRKVQSATPILSHFKIDSYSKPKIVKDITIRIYPHILARRAQVEELEQKLKVDLDREFVGQSEDQKLVLHRLVDKTSRIKERRRAPHGIYEKLDSELYTQFLSDDAKPFETKKVELPFLVPQKSASSLVSDGISSTVTDDLFDLDYPIKEPKLESLVPLEKVLDPQSIQEAIQQKQRSNSISLKQKYGAMVDANTGSKKLATSTLEQDAVIAMKTVSDDLQNWVTDVLDHSITLDPKVLDSVKDIDDKYGQRQTKEQQIETDISGFNVLLNASKPTILESRPPMRLNVVKEMDKRTDSSDDSSKRKKYHTPWYLPVSQWAQANEIIAQQTDPNLGQVKRFGGVVQQKLDEIAKKREKEQLLLDEHGMGRKHSEAKLFKKGHR